MNHAQRAGAVVVLASLMAGCADAPQQAAVTAQPTMQSLVFLTRDGCVNTVAMRENLDAALTALGLPKDYQFLDADTLAPTDPRGGYGTPTVLYAERDLFDMPEPAVPHPPPT